MKWLAALFVGITALAHAEMVGFRYDGTGVFPKDCQPGTNLLWKIELPNFGNGSPIVVGNKLFIVCEAGWPAGADCAVLLCYDAATGRELWRRELDEFAAMPAEQAREARGLRTEYYRRIRRLNELLWQYQSADASNRTVLFKEAGELGLVRERSFERFNWAAGSAEAAVMEHKEFGKKMRKICGYELITWSPTTLGSTCRPRSRTVNGSLCTRGGATCLRSTWRANRSGKHGRPMRPTTITGPKTAPTRR